MCSAMLIASSPGGTSRESWGDAPHFIAGHHAPHRLPWCDINVVAIVSELIDELNQRLQFLQHSLPLPGGQIVIDPDGPNTGRASAVRREGCEGGVGDLFAQGGREG